ncbi:hypothetical protein FIBSPDRAFT_843111 [Athelia psychrophila]|uniref:DUF803-domain-containing protein n=1 Tax=Athelia psychrophila TaxID=1759441 RepID=A0A167VR75_9AGAM|nr:hypothetical protein FIBSPDRAFT_843111 [Fibularhizoctonia sp. CBS 109695]
MRAEYVAPLGSSSLVFNFLFARFLVGTPVTKTDIWGTIVVVIGVIGIVAFGAINSGLSTETDVAHLTYLWRRGGWLAFFFAMAAALALLMLYTTALDAVLAARADLSSAPFAGMGARRGPRAGLGAWGRVKDAWERGQMWIREKLENWVAPKDDKTIAWTLGIGWACCGGGLAGGCLVFAKATVQLISGSLSHENPGNQFGHAAPIFSIILLATTAVLQIICLNRGLKVYDSTLVVPVFYGVYTATGFLNSLIFNNEVDSYKPWVLFLIFVSIVTLIAGVVLLTHKPEPAPASAAPRARAGRHRAKASDARALVHAEDGYVEGEEEEGEGGYDVDGESVALHARGQEHRDAEELWAVGDDDDDDDDEDDFGDVQSAPASVANMNMDMEAEAGEGEGESAGLIAQGPGRPRSESMLSRRSSDPHGQGLRGSDDFVRS